MTPDGLFGLLSSAQCGAFVLATDQTVVFWNRRAREILGYSPDLVLGQRCSAIAREAEGNTLTHDCESGCLMVRSLRAGLVPSRARLQMRCSWGEWKWVVVTPMVVSGVEDDGPLLVYLFGDSGEVALSADVRRLIELAGGTGSVSYDRYPNVGSGGSESPRVAESPVDDYLVLDAAARGSPDEPDQSDTEVPESEPMPSPVRLTQRERQVLSYLAQGWDTRYIAQELGVSWYTARNHIDNLRVKLGASNRLEAVMVAMRLGLIQPE